VTIYKVIWTISLSFDDEGSVYIKKSLYEE